MRLLAAACLIAATALTPGCARNNYLTNRVADLGDIIRVSGMAGAGIAIKGEATRLLHLGGAFTHEVYAAGWHNRALGTWQESVRSWGLIVGYHDEIDITKIGEYSGSYGWTFGEGGMSFQPAADGKYNLDLLTFRIQLMLLLGIDFELRVGEVLDFVAGIFQFDPAGDDKDYESMETPERAEPAPAEEPPAEEGSTFALSGMTLRG